MSQRQKGILCIILSSFSFAMMNLFVHMAGELPSIQKSFFRNFIAMLFALAILLKEKPVVSLDKESKRYLIYRSVFGTIGIVCNFYAVDHMLLSDASLLNKMSPFFSVLFAILFLKEKINLFQLFSIIFAFIGALFVIKPTGINLNTLPALVGLFGGICAGAAYTFVRAMGQRGVQGPVIVFFFSAFSCLVTLPYLVFQFHPMSLYQTVMLLLTGLAATGGQFGITAAYCYAPAKEISVFDYSQIPFAALLGFVFFGQIPDLYSWFGYFIICGTALAMFLYLNEHFHKSKEVLTK
ncbi:MAG: DMT family transporter [Anaerotignum propionicum]|jgi:drug/metabolite transporter (DMT)-like permease|uniref:DMT family transporter n=1 Tax=Anaerotignum propionicum TaxID=28446 RepID=UPI002B21ED94|nr:DMT family transporter [Anaerotignum propionicum]MEA5056923.1 DMT family transporter [Anaerotignum propionicum]